MRLARADRGISIHPPRGGWDSYKMLESAKSKISIHPPRGGWDVGFTCFCCIPTIFQSTHPVGGGTSTGRAVMSGQ